MTGFSRLALPLLGVGFLLFVLVWPLLRLHRETGVWGIVLHRETEPGQRLMGLCFLAMQLGFVALVVMYAARGPAALGVWSLPPVVAGLGLAVACSGLVGIGVAQRQMGASFRVGIDEAETALVHSGLFAHIRNPIFSGLLVFLAGLVLVILCTWTLLGWLAAAATIAYQTRLEERHLLAQHGDRYRTYASRVGRFLPGIGRLPIGGAG